MNQDYSLSVVIPNFNKSAYIRQCVESILSQTLLPNEIIIVDDLSTDNSREIIQGLCENSPLIKPIFLKENGGVSHARNTGIRSANSKYVTFVDADDFYENQDKLKNEMELIHIHGEEIVAYSKILQVDAKGQRTSNVLPPKKAYLEGSIYSKMLTGDFNFSTIARDYCVKKAAFLDVGGFDETKNLYEDMELTIKLAKEHPFYCTHQIGTAYRQIDNGLSKNQTVNHRKKIKEIFEGCVQEHNMPKKLWYRFLRLFVRAKQGMFQCIWKCKDVIKKFLK